MDKVMTFLSGKKMYILLGLLAILTFVNGTPPGSLDLGALLSDNNLLEQELMLALIAAGRSAVSKIGAS